MSGVRIPPPLQNPAEVAPCFLAKRSLGESQIRVENIEVNAVPKDWLEDVTKCINQLLPIWFSRLEIFQSDKTALKYCEFSDVREVNVHNGRLEIVVL